MRLSVPKIRGKRVSEILKCLNKLLKEKRKLKFSKQIGRPLFDKVYEYFIEALKCEIHKIKIDKSSNSKVDNLF